MTRKEQRKPPGVGDGNSQENVPTVFRIATENTHLDLVELPLDLLVFLCPKVQQLLRVARIDAYSPTRHRPADATGLGHAPLVNSTLDAKGRNHPRSSQNGCGSPDRKVLSTKATEFRIFFAFSFPFFASGSTPRSSYILLAR